MRDTEKRVGGQWGRTEGTWKKKKPAPKEPVQVPIAEPKQKRKEPEATVQPATKSKIKPRPALAIKDEEPAETFARKYKAQTKATQGKFEKRRKERREEGRREEILDAIPPVVQEYREEGRAKKYIKRSAEVAQTVKTGLKNIAQRAMKGLLNASTEGVNSVKKGVSSTPQALIMQAMVNRLKNSGRRRVKGYKAPSPRRRRDR